MKVGFKNLLYIFVQGHLSHIFYLPNFELNLPKLKYLGYGISYIYFLLLAQIILISLLFNDLLFITHIIIFCLCSITSQNYVLDAEQIVSINEWVTFQSMGGSLPWTLEEPTLEFFLLSWETIALWTAESMLCPNPLWWDLEMG